MLSEFDLQELDTFLHYMNIKELKEVCLHFNLSDSGMKKEIIRRIINFLRTGEITKIAMIPEVSKAKKGQKYPLAPNTLILFGNYKNDLITRNFFKKLIGPHFHFTAFGQDWIKQRWMKKNPPTYAEFAEFWQEEYQKRKIKKAPLKQEWAYLNFIQKYIEEHPETGKKEITQNWKKTRLHYVNLAKNILKKAESK